MTLCQLYYIFTIEVMHLANVNMKVLRVKHGLSQEALAKIVSVSRQTIILIEQGDYNPSLQLCIKICKALNVTLNDLFWEAFNDV